MTTLLTTPFTPRSTAADVLAGIDLAGRRILVTGGASGLGLETSRALAAAGAEVTVAVRRPGATAPAGLEGVRQVPLDLADLASVRRLVDSWEGPLDVLVANAGVMAIPHRELTPQGWELQLATNFLGHFALTVGLHGRLAEAGGRRGGARVVVVSSGAHLGAPLDLGDPQFERRAYDRWTAYGQSKSADVLFAVGAADRWAADGIVANALNPGWINTGLQRHVDDDTMRALGAMDEAGDLIEADYYKTPAQGASTQTMLAADYYKTPAQGASTQTMLAGSPLVDGVTGRYFDDNRETEVSADASHGVAAHAVDRETASGLWALATRTLSDA